MNRAHRSIWNSSLGAWVAVSEIAAARGKRSGGASLALAGTTTLALALLIGSAPALAGGDGGASRIGAGTSGSGSSAGGAGNAPSGGGLGGGLGADGGNGAGGANSSGGGGGGTGLRTATNGGNGTPISGGNGGSGGSNNIAGGGGGGGAGAVLEAGVTSFTNSSTLTGGNGGSGGNGPSRNGGGGGGGAGAVVAAGSVSLTNSGSISGGNGGSIGSGTGVSVAGGGGEGGAAGSTSSANDAQGGAGITGSGMAIINSGTIKGGLSANNVQANAITFTGGSNSLTLQSGSALTGAIEIGTGATASIVAGSSGLTLSNNIVLGGNGTIDTQANTMTVSGVVSGASALSKNGAGNLILTGTNTYTGTTSVNAGTLSVNGSVLNSALTVNNGGTLGGSGTVGSTTIASGGILAPGNSIGTLTVNGNLNIAAGSTYRVEVDAAGANDRVNVTGTATLNGGTVDVQASAGTYAANTSYTLLNATGGLTGTFAGVTSNLAFLTPTLGYTANNVSLSLARNNTSFSAVAVTPNQIATSTALQNFGSTGDAGTVQTALTGLSAAQARAAYDAASGAGVVSLRRAGASFAQGFANQLQSRLGSQANTATATAFSGRPSLLASTDALAGLSELIAQTNEGPQKYALAGSASALSSSASNAGRGFWLRGYGGYQNSDADNNAAASRQRDSGMSAGFDTQAGNGMRLGAALSAGTARLSTDNNETGKARNTALAVYGSYAAGPWSFSGSASYAWGSNHMDRNIVVGALNRTASGDFDSNTLAAYGEANYTVPMNGWTLQPLAALSLSRYKSDGFTETGAGALNLQVAGQTTTSTRTLLGARASFDTGAITLEPRLVWSHEFGDLNAPLTARFQGAGAAPFQVSGTALKRDALIVGLGAQGNISKGVTLFADVQAQVSSGQRSISALVGLRSRW